MTMDNWYIATSRPRILGGANSEIYRGASTEAIPTPSPPMSRAITKKVKDAGLLLDIKLLDHLIITQDNNYYSFADDGIL